MPRLDPNLLLHGYASGVFPMADSRDTEDLFWVEPKERAILPLRGFHLSRSLAKRLRQDRFRVTTDTAFGEVVLACADRDETWINRSIEAAMMDLYHLGAAHSVEVWDGDELVGGLYGASLGRAFFGESMFSRRTDASKVALAWLVAHLLAGRFSLLDCQFMTEHLASLGALTVPRKTYVTLLAEALAPAGRDSLPDWGALDALLSASGVESVGAGKFIAQLLGQTS